MSLSFAGLMCHAPIVVPAVGGARSAQCEATTRAMREVAARAVDSRPDRLVLISPHAPRKRDTFSAWVGPHRGDLADFRAAGVRVELPDAPEVAEALGLPPVDAGSRPRFRPAWLDHGGMVPLAFLWEAGWRGPTAILALPWGDADGEALGRAIAALPGRTALIASGDMSHRLQPDAPAGYHPRAAAFDRAFVDALRADDWAAALGAQPREVAAEDVIDAVRVAMAAAGAPLHAEVLSYEGPWGVGYTEAVLYDPAPPLYAVARRAVHAQVTGSPYAPPEGGPGPAGAFVTLTRGGQLRGCIGHITPLRGRLLEELDEVARLSASRDPRFPPVKPDELADLEVEVSVLEPPRPCAPGEVLDPRVDGLILEARGRRGLLLPDIDGVDTPALQDSIVRRKAGLSPTEPAQRSTFRVRKVAPP